MKSTLQGQIGIDWRWVMIPSTWARNRRPLSDGIPVRVVAGLLRRDGQILMCHRHPNRASYPDVWDFPGGHIEAGESMASALVRELDEELGIHVEAPDQPPWVTVRTDRIELNLFLIDRWEGEPRNVATNEHDDTRWVKPDELAQLDLAHPSYLQLMRRALQ